MSGKRTAQERFPEVIAAAVRVFTHEGYRAARMSDVAAPGCLEVEVRGDVARCRVPSAAVALRELLAWAACNGLGDLDDLTVETPTLEDAYLRLVDGGTR